jgi:hypothetical protein
MGERGTIDPWAVIRAAVAAYREDPWVGPGMALAMLETALGNASQHAERDALAEHLAQVLATSDPLPPDGVDVAVAAKRLLERLGYEGDGR